MELRRSPFLTFPRLQHYDLARVSLEEITSQGDRAYRFVVMPLPDLDLGQWQPFFVVVRQTLSTSPRFVFVCFHPHAR